MTHIEVELERTTTFVRSYIAEHGYPPCIREIMDSTHAASTSVVAYRLKLLEQRGILRRGPHGLSRTITLIELPKEVVI